MCWGPLAYGQETPMKIRAVSLPPERIERPVGLRFCRGVPRPHRGPLSYGLRPRDVPDDSAPMQRATVPEADREIGVRHPVLSHGFVALVDYMGNDAAIVQAARVSYGQGTKSVRDDRG